MKATKILFYHLILGLLYTVMIALGTWNVSGGDISYWIFSSICLAIHLLIIMFTKGGKEGFIAWLLIFGLIIITSFISGKIYHNRGYKEGIEFNR
jgi:hypothetical protein